MYLLYRLGSDTDIHPSGCNQVDLVATGFESSDAVMDAVAATLNDHGGPGSFAMGVISHLSSVPACVLPVARFCVALQGVPVLVDGAREYSLHRFGRSARLKILIAVAIAVSKQLLSCVSACVNSCRCTR